ncbi:MAG TPA: YqgE/AlgH family protein [Burkholderiales bacterium]|nr:YqgE/AlgH family protein [Burkholderiales bacterium]
MILKRSFPRGVQRAALGIFLASLAGLLSLPLPARADDTSETVLLVAKRTLRDPFYRSTVLVVRPIGQDQHVGVIINRPTRVTLGQLFPDHEPSRRVRDPVYLGGPTNASVIFALVHRQGSPGGKSIEFLPDLFMAFESKTVDAIIEKEPDHARFLAGLVAWRPGELRDELRRGAWHVMDPDPELILREPDGLWEELVSRAEVRANGI